MFIIIQIDFTHLFKKKVFPFKRLMVYLSTVLQVEYRPIAKKYISCVSSEALSVG